MEFERLDPPRVFAVSSYGVTQSIEDHGRILLDPLQQVTFVTPGKSEYDVTRTEWGYYATPSLNGRLARFGLRAALVLSSYSHLFVMLVEHGKEPEFLDYLTRDGQTLLTWLDQNTDVAKIAAFYQQTCSNGA